MKIITIKHRTVVFNTSLSSAYKLRGQLFPYYFVLTLRHFIDISPISVPINRSKVLFQSVRIDRGSPSSRSIHLSVSSSYARPVSVLCFSIPWFPRDIHACYVPDPTHGLVSVEGNTPSEPNEISIARSSLSVTANRLDPAVTSSERWMLSTEMRNHSAARGIMCGK